MGGGGETYSVFGTYDTGKRLNKHCITMTTLLNNKAFLLLTIITFNSLFFTTNYIIRAQVVTLS